MFFFNWGACLTNLCFFDFCQVVTDVIPCAKESYTDCLSKTRSFIQIEVRNIVEKGKIA